ncbi:unnamed protein product, partial [Absidia cylindrospora]
NKRSLLLYGGVWKLDLDDYDCAHDLSYKPTDATCLLKLQSFDPAKDTPVEIKDFNIDDGARFRCLVQLYARTWNG